MAVELGAVTAAELEAACRCVGEAPVSGISGVSVLDQASSTGGSKVKERSTRGSVSNENNILLDPEVLTDYPTQALLLTVLVCTCLIVFLYFI